MTSWKQILDEYRERSSGSSDMATRVSREEWNADISGSLHQNLRTLREWLGDNGDMVVREFRLLGSHDAAALFFSSMTDTQQIHEHILAPLMEGEADSSSPVRGERALAETICSRTVHVSKTERHDRYSEVFDLMAQGSLVLFVEGMHQALTFDVRQIEKRGIEQPQTEQVIRGARDGFIEALETNLSLLRRRVQSPDLKVVISTMGSRSATRVALAYVDGIVDPGLVKETMRRLAQIDVGTLIDSGYIEQFIEDFPLSPFPQVQNTERPDKTAAALQEGRVAILMDGSPFVLIVPALFNQFFQTIDDYSERFIIGSLIRLIRLVALLFSLFFPALYVSLISFNPELIPTEFAVAVSGGRAGVPFPAVVEVLVMEVAMEVLREATIRLPQIIGGALSIVGVLVIGQAAVSAGLSSPITVVIVAMTTIGSFATPAYNAAISLRMLRFPLIMLAGMFGLYGVMIGTVLIVNHLLFLESFGVPYMTPLIGGKWRDMKDSLIRAPLWTMIKRPSFLHSPDMTRLPDDETDKFATRILRKKGEAHENKTDESAGRSDRN